jgi:hypothetical protein
MLRVYVSSERDAVLTSAIVIERQWWNSCQVKQGGSPMPIGNPDLAPLVGSWRLLTAETTFADTGERIDLFGQSPDGRMVLASTGRIVFLLAKSNQQPPTNDADRATLFNDMAAYTGWVRSDGPGRFITTVDLAWNAAWTGEQMRFYTIYGDRLTIRTPEQAQAPFPGRLGVGVLVWEREHPVG